ncbi:hypothetical protein IMZ48_03545 [Candidatus Bathyarchaeota archaeon]|nr:hypothetical protein [Candidatus Bathyarchaeota archaeon]
MAVQFVEEHFVDSYYPTIENTFTKTIRYKNQDFTTEIVDTAGQVSAPMVVGAWTGFLPGRRGSSLKLTVARWAGRVQHPQLEALHRHPRVHARVLGCLSPVL